MGENLGITAKRPAIRHGQPRGGIPGKAGIGRNLLAGPQIDGGKNYWRRGRCSRRRRDSNNSRRCRIGRHRRHAQCRPNNSNA